MIATMALTMWGCHLFDDGEIAQTCEETALGCQGADDTAPTEAPPGDDTGGADDTGAAAADLWLYSLSAGRTGGGAAPRIVGYGLSSSGDASAIQADPWVGDGSADVEVSALDLVAVGSALVATNNTDVSLGLYAVNGDGTLEPATPTPTNGKVSYIAPHPSLDLLYVVGSGEMEAYTLDDAEPLLTAFPDLFLSDYSGYDFREVQVHPSGERLVVVDQDRPYLTVYTIEAGGALNLKTAYTFDESSVLTDVLFHPSGEYLFVRDLTQGIIVLGYDLVADVFSAVQVVRDIQEGLGMTMSHDGRWIYATEATTTALRVFEFDPSSPTTGEVLVARSDLDANVGEYSRYLAVSPDDGLLFSSSEYENTIYIHTLTDGAPTLKSTLEGGATETEYALGPLVVVEP